MIDRPTSPQGTDLSHVVQSVTGARRAAFVPVSGSGQIYAGETRKGLIWAIPMFIFVVAVVLLLFGGTQAMLGLVTQHRRSAPLLLAFNVAFFLYHVAAMLDAYDVAQHERARSFGAGGAAVRRSSWRCLVVNHHRAARPPRGLRLPGRRGASTRSSRRPPPGGIIPSFSPITPGPQTPTPATSPTPAPTRTPGSSSTPGTGPSGSPGAKTPTPTRAPLPAIDCATLARLGPRLRLTVLVAGTDSRSDSGVDDDSIRTDSMILLTIDIQSGKAALFSFPRNMCTAADGRCGEGTRYPTGCGSRCLREDAQTPAGQLRSPMATTAACLPADQPDELAVALRGAAS